MNLLANLRAHHAKWEDCTACPLGELARRHCTSDLLNPLTSRVSGSSRADILFVGEGPGEVENARGVPFCGPSGQYLRKALFRAGHPLDNLVIVLGNLVVCRPQNTRRGPNRIPTEAEISACSARLRELIEACNPQMVVSLGKTSQEHVPALLQEMAYQGRWASLYHPSYILHKGGLASPESDRYIENLATLLNRARSLKEGCVG